jgi:hypothetical protein
MALPILWLGAAAISVLAVNGLADDRKKQQRSRRHSRYAENFSMLKQHESPIAAYPTDLLNTEEKVIPEIGSVVCCGIGGVLEHTGIWVGDNTIIELDGNGLIKPISIQRFTKERSGNKMFIACDSTARPIACEVAASRALNNIFNCLDYHIIDNNCHQFIWQCFKPKDNNLTTFKELNTRLAILFDRKIYWDICDC